MAYDAQEWRRRMNEAYKKAGRPDLVRPESEGDTPRATPHSSLPATALGTYTPAGYSNVRQTPSGSFALAPNPDAPASLALAPVSGPVGDALTARRLIDLNKQKWYEAQRKGDAEAMRRLEQANNAFRERFGLRSDELYSADVQNRPLSAAEVQALGPQRFYELTGGDLSAFEAAARGGFEDPELAGRGGAFRGVAAGESLTPQTDLGLLSRIARENANAQPDTSGLNSIHRDIQADLAALRTARSDELVASSQFYQNMLAQIEKTRQDLLARAEQQQRELDPGTQLSLDILKREMEEGLKRARETANRRGILDSGIALGLQTEVEEGAGQQRAIILNSRLQRIQEQTEAELRRLAERALDVGMQQGQEAAEIRRRFSDLFRRAQESGLQRLDEERRFQIGRSDQLRQSGLQGLLNLSSIERQIQDRDEQRRLERARLEAGLTGVIPEGFPNAGQQTFDAKKFAENLAAAERRAREAADARNDRLDEQQSAEQQAAEVAAGMYTAKQQGRSRDEMLRMIEQNRGRWAPVTIQRALQELNRLWPLPTPGQVDINSLINGSGPQPY